MTELRVVSYNVHTLRDDQAALRSVVRGLAPDVLILQEAPRRFRWRTRTASLAHDFGLVVAVGGLPALGNLVLTNLRVRVHQSSCVRFPLTPGRHLRGAALATCSVGASRFAVVGSHLSTDPIERPGQATLLKKAMSEMDAPVIVGADLNESAGGTPWHTVADGLVDSAVAADRAGMHTFSCANPHDRIDALFIDPAIQVRGYDVVDTAETRRASDHFPLVADLTLPD